MLHQLAGTTIQIANLAIYNCNPLEGGNTVLITVSTKGPYLTLSQDGYKCEPLKIACNKTRISFD